MKRTALIIGLVCSVVTLKAQIPNNDFENSTLIQVERPGDWDFAMGNPEKVTDTVSGQYALKLTGAKSAQGDSIPGALVQGNFWINTGEIPGNGVDDDGNGWADDYIHFSGGHPFASRPDSIIFWAKYNIAADDSAMVYIELKKGGNSMLTHRYYIKGNSPDFKRLSFPMYQGMGELPDSIILAFFNTDIEGTIRPSNYIIIDDISFSSSGLTVDNPGFENWTILSDYSMDGWYDKVDKFNLLGNSAGTITRTTDKASGSYAVLIQNIPGVINYLGGKTSTGENKNIGLPTFKVSGVPDTLYGLYKWFQEKNDTCRFSITMYQGGKIIGGGGFYGYSSQNSYAIFKVPIHYGPNPAPDSANINIQSYFSHPQGNSKLYVDNLSFDPSFGLGNAVFSTAQFSVFPNPARSDIQVQLPYAVRNAKAQIISMNGRVEKDYILEGLNPTLNIQSLTTGCYLLKIEGFSGVVKITKD